MSARICPKTNEKCEHEASCNHIDACNKPIPIGEFERTHPEAFAKIIEGLKLGTIVLS